VPAIPEEISEVRVPTFRENIINRHRWSEGPHKECLLVKNCLEDEPLPHYAIDNIHQLNNIEAIIALSISHELLPEERTQGPKIYALHERPR